MINDELLLLVCKDKWVASLSDSTMTSKTGEGEGGGIDGSYDDLLKQCYESARMHQKTLPDNAELELFTHRSNEKEVELQ